MTGSSAGLRSCEGQAQHSCSFLTAPCKPQDSEPLEVVRVAQAHVRFLWRWVLMPLLFCLIGTIIDFNTLPGSTIPRAVGLIFAGGRAGSP